MALISIRVKSSTSQFFFIFIVSNTCQSRQSIIYLLLLFIFYPSSSSNLKRYAWMTFSLLSLHFLDAYLPIMRIIYSFSQKNYQNLNFHALLLHIHGDIFLSVVCVNHCLGIFSIASRFSLRLSVFCSWRTDVSGTILVHILLFSCSFFPFLISQTCC